MLASLYLALWRQAWTMCALLLRKFFPACALMCNFSLMHNWHSPRPGVYGLAVRVISHDISGNGLRLFSHTYAKMLFCICASRV